MLLMLVHERRLGKSTDVKFTWFLDQFGNVIGSVGSGPQQPRCPQGPDLERRPPARTAHAEATLITFDGSATEKTVTVNKIDGFDSAASTEEDAHYKWVKAQGAVPHLRDNRNNMALKSMAPRRMLRSAKTTAATPITSVSLCTALRPTMTTA